MATKTSALRKKKKTWFAIMSPKELGNYNMGETLADSGNDLVGRNVKISVGSLLNDPKKYHVQLGFKIQSAREKHAITEVISYELLPSYVKRILRKGRDRVADSFICETKDKLKVRVKPLVITRTKTQRSVLGDIRKTMRTFLTEKFKTQNYSDIINDIITTKLQREMREKLKKIYPIVVSEFKLITR